MRKWSYACIVYVATVASGAAQQVYGGAGYGAVGIVQIDVSHLNAALSPEGFSGFRSFGISSGAFGYGVIGKFIVGGEYHSVSFFRIAPNITGTSGTSALDASEWSFGVGYLVYQTPNLFVYPLFGIGIDEFHLQLEKNVSGTFDEAINSFADNVYMVKQNLRVNLGVRVDLMVLGGGSHGGGGGFYVEVNPGYALEITGNGWALAGRALSGGPGLRLEGPYLRIMIGMGGFAYR